MLGVVISDGGDTDDTASEVDAEAESAAGMVFDTVDEIVPNAEPEASGATKVESGTLIGVEAGTLADPGSDVCTAAVGAVSGTGDDFGSLMGAVAVASVAAAVSAASVVATVAAVTAAASSRAFSGTMAMAGGGLVTCASGAGDKNGSKWSEGTAGLNKSEPGPETDDKSERNCCSSAGPICRLGVAG